MIYGTDSNAAPSYQRLIQRSRLKQIADFIRSGGFFPNTVILNFKQRVRFDVLKPEDEDGVVSGVLTLPSTYKSAWIIDGQHRIYGYSELDEAKHPPLLPFLAFENITITDETKLFSDINSKQKRVEKKLLNEITGEIRLESADKKEQIRAIASRVFDLMRDDDDDGPLGGKITGVEIKHSDASILTIPYLVDAVVQSGMLGRVGSKDGKDIFTPGSISWPYPKDGIVKLTEFLTAYFDFFRNANPERWNAGKFGRFATNPGASGLIRFAGDLITYLATKESVDPAKLHPKTLAERIEKYAEPCTAYFRQAADDEIEQRFQIPFGSGGPRIFQHRLRELSSSKYDDFDAPGFADDLRKYDAQRTQSADKMVRAIQESVHGFVVTRLKDIYGPGEDYLEKAVESRDILKKAFDKRLEADNEDRKNLETYFDFLDLRKIIDNPRNWPFFSDKLDIALPNDRKGKARYVSWFDEINETRRIPAHPYNRGYSDQEISTLEFVYRKLIERGIISDIQA